eukprot:4364431-Prorocentrum_lima.AAC.1
MDVQHHRPAAQLRGLFRTVVLQDNCASGQAQTEPYVQRLWLKGRSSKAPRTREWANLACI